MPKTARIPNHASNHRKPGSSSAIVEEILRLSDEGRWEQLEAKARAIATRQPGSALGWRAMATARLNMGKLPEAVMALTRTVAIVPDNVSAHGDLGLAYLGLERNEQARASYLRAVQINPQRASAHSGLAVALGRLGRVDDAMAHHRRALELEPSRHESHNDLANLHRDLGQYEEAASHYRRALELRPDFFEAHLNLGLTLSDLEQFDEAIASHRRAVSLSPGSHLALLGLGSLLSRLGHEEAEARACLERCIELQPNNPDGHVALGNEHLRKKEMAASMVLFRQAQALRPLIRRPGLDPRADFTALMLDTPGAGCTPMDYLSGRAPYDRQLYCVLPQECEHIELLRASAQVVINMIADADNGTDILPFAQDLVERLGLPTINHPRLVARSGREAVARRLAGTPLCLVPATVRLPASELMDPAFGGLPAELSLPLLARMAGTHGGDVFEKCDDAAAVAGFAARHPEADVYLTEYVDYRSGDGLFRKYRFIAIDGELFPYHLAIHDHWMVHHFRTDMRNQEWMRQEEEAFLERPDRVFDGPRQDALISMAAASGLEYCGLDVGLDREGRVVLFETNASMLVHDEKQPAFLYKNRFVSRIKKAFDEMVARRAGHGVTR